jgi:YebC/PmpR family DNA-binding regulatory protein
MSGHSKWATTKHRKAAQDSKRSALFSKLSRIITVAAKEGGDPSPENNSALAAAVDKAKAYSLPKDKIDTAIKKAFGAGSGAAIYETIIYEGYGPAGVAVYLDCLTDNRNRTAADVRAAFSHAGGNLGTTGSVAFQFERKGRLFVEKAGNAEDEDEFMMAVAEAGGEDYVDDDEQWVVYTDPKEVANVRTGLKEQKIEVKGAELCMVPTTTTAVTVSDAKKVMRLIDKLEELDDVQNVYNTMELTDEVLEALEADE